MLTCYVVWINVVLILNIFPRDETHFHDFQEERILHGRCNYLDRKHKLLLESYWLPFKDLWL